MRRHSTRDHFGTLSELNVTPLLDLAFVLLIIFMITAPFLAESSDLVIPTSKASNEAVDPAKVFTLSVNRDGDLDLNGAPIERDELPAGLASLMEAHPGLAVLVRAHHELPIQELVGIMDVLKTAGISRVGLVTKPDVEA